MVSVIRKRSRIENGWRAIQLGATRGAVELRDALKAGMSHDDARAMAARAACDAIRQIFPTMPVWYS
jgi:hypothetical protein